MAKITKTATKAVTQSCNLIMRIGRWIGARRALFVWSAASVAIMAFVRVPEAVSIYMSGQVNNLTLFLVGQFMIAIVLFLKIFAPIFIMIIASKYIFDCRINNMGRASFTFKLSFWISAIIGLAIAALYYFDSGNIIGGQFGSQFCTAGQVCWFSWPMLWMAGRVFLGTGITMFMLIVGLRGIYNESSFMLEKKD